MENKTGCIVGRLSPGEMERVIIGSDDKDIRAKFMGLLNCWHLQKRGSEDLVISEFKNGT